jgi:hypothetical protein
MKKIIVSLLALSMLSGCAIIDAYLMTKFDSAEYGLITTIRSEAQQFKSQCDNAQVSKENAVKLSNNTRTFELYSENIPRNENGYKASKSLNEIAQGLTFRYGNGPVSVAFCKIKFESIENSATVIQHTLGNRPR